MNKKEWAISLLTFGLFNLARKLIAKQAVKRLPSAVLDVLGDAKNGLPLPPEVDDLIDQIAEERFKAALAKVGDVAKHVEASQRHPKSYPGSQMLAHLLKEREAAIAEGRRRALAAPPLKGP